MNGPPPADCAHAAARDEFFAGARFAENANAGFARGYAFHLRYHATHGLALPHDFVFAEAAGQIAIFALEAAEFQGVLHGQEEFFGGDRFSRKSSAPRRVARTAISMCAWLTS